MSIRYSKHLPSLVFVFDLLLLNVALEYSLFVIKNTGFAQNITPIFSLLVNMSWVIVSLMSKSFHIKRPLVFKDNINRFLLTVTYHLLLVMSIIYFFKIYEISRPVIVLAYMIFIVLVAISRYILFFCLDYYRKKGYNHRRIVVIGDDNIADRLIDSFSKHPEYGYDLDCFIAEDQIIKSPGKTFKVILEKRPDEIFVCYKQLNVELLNDIVNFGSENGIKIKVVSDLLLVDKFVKLINYDDIPVLQIISQPEISLRVKIFKRSFDVLFSSFVVITGFPVFLLIYIITKASSSGPAFYRQERIGLNQKPFYIYKFRSMYINSELAGPQLSKDNDPRITKWGMVMRKTRLDELPQFYNVLKGEMSIVGPRPERQYFIEKIIEITPGYKKLFSLKPGITSMGQVNYGYAENINQMCDRIKYDMLYLDNMNLNSDLGIILKTVKVMIQAKGK